MIKSSETKIKMALLSRNQEEIFTYVMEAIKSFEKTKEK